MVSKIYTILLISLLAKFLVWQGISTKQYQTIFRKLQNIAREVEKCKMFNFSEVFAEIPV